MRHGVFIGPEVDLACIAPDAILHPGCRISGAKTSIGPGSELGAEAPVVIENCQLGRSVKLKGGYFSGAVFFDGAGMGSGAHVREGTILEEEANGAHAVGLKQTVLFPFVTLGSLINFCDILMAGGTSRKNHGEVGSSYVHFNFTPHQDKATASLVGDVPRGVLLDQKPVFLGGQGGLVGPARIAYGCVVAAGGVCRRDLTEENQLHIPAVPAEQTMPYEQGVYKGIGRIVKNNRIYIGNVRALKAWYENVRVRFIRDDFDRACYEGALTNLDLILKERIKRLDELAGKMDHSARVLAARGGDFLLAAQKQREFARGWAMLSVRLEVSLDQSVPAGFIGEIETAGCSGYISAIQNLSRESKIAATAWLQSMVDEAAGLSA